MRKIIVLSFITLDGVMQAPGGPDEDLDDGFKHGGWTVPYWDDVSGEIMDRQMSGQFDLLLGRKTYDIFAGYWPHQEGEIPAGTFNSATKYVVSNSSPELTWENSTLIDGDVATKLKELKQGDGPMLQVHGSGNMIQTLLQNDLVDELWLKIFPVTLGSGKKLFESGTLPAAFELMDHKVTTKGVIFADYIRAGEVKLGSFS